MERIDLMHDLETLGTEPDAPILSIGACKFDIDTGEILQQFYFPIGWHEAVMNQPGRVPCKDTIEWWHKQEPAAFNAVHTSDGDLRTALDCYLRFIGEDDVLPWSNGATFDTVILEDALKKLGLGVPWKFWNVRDVRTVVDLASEFVDRRSLKFEGTRHNALDDAVHQAKYVSRMWNVLRYRDLSTDEEA